MQKATEEAEEAKKRVDDWQDILDELNEEAKNLADELANREKEYAPEDPDTDTNTD